MRWGLELMVRGCGWERVGEVGVGGVWGGCVCVCVCVCVCFGVGVCVFVLVGFWVWSFVSIPVRGLGLTDVTPGARC